MYLTGQISHPFCWFVLNKDGIVIDFEASIECLEYKKDEVIGKNWFEFFVEQKDLDKELVHFDELLKQSNYKYTRHSLDLRCKNNKHIYVDTILNFTSHDGEKYIEITGFEHFSNYRKNSTKENKWQKKY